MFIRHSAAVGFTVTAVGLAVFGLACTVSCFAVTAVGLTACGLNVTALLQQLFSDLRVCGKIGIGIEPREGSIDRAVQIKVSVVVQETADQTGGP